MKILSTNPAVSAMLSALGALAIFVAYLAVRGTL